MKSFRQLYQKLPAEFIGLLESEYEPRFTERILNGFMVERPVTLRVNTIKSDVRTVMEVLRRENIKFERVLWYEDALIIRNRREKELEGLVIYQEGHIYLQSLSSMLPPLVLHPEPGMKVLDLTAAPGGKSTQMAALMKNEGFLLANEVNQIRAERLKFNVERQGALVIEVRVGDGKFLDEQYHQYFDAVLLDAPCSGVGLFCLANSQTYRGWSLRTVNQLSKEQKKLAQTAIWALKPGGSLVYSTCTLVRQENEAVVDWVLERFPAVKLDRLPEGVKAVEPNQLLPVAEKFRESALAILPSELMEGFFVVRFRKDEG